jgi:asparagine synthase (glutamine-hydrolysing)
MVKEVSKYGIPVILTGHGGDELLAGYWDHYHYNFHDLRGSRNDETNEIDAWKQNHGRSMTEYEEFEHKIQKAIGNRYFEVEKFSHYMNCLSPGIRDRSTISTTAYKVECSSELTRRLYLELLYETIPACLRAEDRNCMAFSIENRVPFLDHRLAEFCLPLNNRLKIKNGYGKYILRKGTEAGLLPNKVGWRKDKVGHNAPADDWYRNENKRELETLFLRNNVVNNEIYDIKTSKDIFDRHMGGENHATFMWQFINTHLWYDQWFDA